MPLTFYYGSGSPYAWRVWLALEHKQIAYALTTLSFSSGDLRKPEYLAINPNGAVPAAMDGEFALSESNAILQYAADLSGSDTYYPKNLKHRADINRWLLWEGSTWFPSCYVYLVEYVVKPLLKAEPDQAVIDKEAPNWHRLAGILDARLAKTNWLAGDNVTIADIAVAAPVHVHKWQHLPLNEHTNLARWMADVERLPCWQKTQGAVERALQLR